MRAKCSGNELVKATGALLLFKPSRRITRLLRYAAISASSSGLALIYNTFEVYAVKTIPAEVDEPGVATVPIDTFHAVANQLRGGTVAFESGDNDQLRIISGKTTISFNGVDVTELVLERPVAALKPLGPVDCQFLGEAVRAASRAAGPESDDLWSVLFFAVVGNEMRIAATDRHRLSEVSVPISGPAGAEISFALRVRPLRGAVAVMSKLGAGDIGIAISDDRKWVGMDSPDAGLSLIIRTWERAIPDYRQIVHVDNPDATTVTVNRDTLLRAIKICQSTEEEESRAIRIDVRDGKLVLSSTSGGDTASVTVDAAISGQDQTVVMQSKFLADAVRGLGAESTDAIIQIAGSTAPVIVYDETRTFVHAIMPMQR